MRMEESELSTVSSELIWLLQKYKQVFN